MSSLLLTDSLFPLNEDLGSFNIKCDARNEVHYDLTTLLGIAQNLHIDQLSTMYNAVDAFGRGATSDIKHSVQESDLHLAFKQTSRLYDSVSESEFYQVLITEVFVLGTPIIRDSPTIVDLEGICWEINDQGYPLPVLVYQRTMHDNLSKFLSTDEGKSLSTEQRLGICMDIAAGLAALHTCTIVHGDVKPDNVLVFRQEDGTLLAKLTDFGYASFALNDQDMLKLPCSRPWQAPEHHHRGFEFCEAQKQDTYSFGLLCLFIIRHEHFDLHGSQPEDGIARPLTQSTIEEAKRKKSMGELAITQLLQMENLHDYQLGSLTQLLGSCLQHEHAVRSSDWKRVGELLSNALGPDEKFLWIEIEAPVDASKLFHCCPRVAELLPTLPFLDYRVRRHIHHSLEKRALQKLCPACNHKAAVQLSFCNALALGGVITCNDKQIGQADDEYRSEVDEELRYLQSHPKINYTSDTIRQLENNDTLLQAQVADHYIAHVPFADAETVYVREIAAATSHLGSHGYPAALLEVLAHLYRAFGKFKEFKETASTVVDMHEERYGQTSLNTLMAQVQLGVAHRELGDWKASEKVLEYVVRTMRETRGTDFPSTRDSMSELGCTYRLQGRWEDAERLDEEIVNLELETYGHDHPNTLISISNLAATYYGQNRLKLAMRLQVHVLDLTTAVMGPEHTETLSSMANLAVTYTDLGKFKKAKKLNKAVFSTLSKSLGYEHPDTISVMHNLAQVYFSLKKMGKARELSKAAVLASSETLGVNHPQTLIILDGLAEIDQGLKMQ